MKKIYIPSNLNLAEKLNNHNKYELDKFHYLIHLIYEQRILYKNKEEYIPLKSLYLRRIVNDDVESYREILINQGIIDCDKKYIKNKKSYGYKLTKPYSGVRHKEIELTNPYIIRNIERWKKKRLPNTEIHLHLYKFLSEIEINYEDALDYIENLSVEEYNCAKIAISKFLNKDFFLYSDDFGRVHTNLTSLKSTIRKFLTYKKEKLINIDIVNSQPLLLLITNPFLPSIRCALSNIIESCENDLLKYKRLVEGGELYDYLMQKMGECDRKTFKEKFFRETFFGTKICKEFKELFPTVTSMLLEIKKKDYRQLAWMMQRAESNLIISKICGRIMNEHKDVFIATIHDSILTTEPHVDKIRDIMVEEFSELNLSPSIRIELA